MQQACAHCTVERAQHTAVHQASGARVPVCSMDCGLAVFRDTPSPSHIRAHPHDTELCLVHGDAPVLQAFRMHANLLLVASAPTSVGSTLESQYDATHGAYVLRRAVVEPLQAHYEQFIGPKRSDDDDDDDDSKDARGKRSSDSTAVSASKRQATAALAFTDLPVEMLAQIFVRLRPAEQGNWARTHSTLNSIARMPGMVGDLYAQRNVLRDATTALVLLHKAIEMESGDGYRGGRVALFLCDVFSQVARAVVQIVLRGNISNNNDGDYPRYTSSHLSRVRTVCFHLFDREVGYHSVETKSPVLYAELSARRDLIVFLTAFAMPSRLMTLFTDELESAEKTADALLASATELALKLMAAGLVLDGVGFFPRVGALQQRVLPSELAVACRALGRLFMAVSLSGSAPAQILIFKLMALQARHTNGVFKDKLFFDQSDFFSIFVNDDLVDDGRMPHFELAALVEHYREIAEPLAEYAVAHRMLWPLTQLRRALGPVFVSRYARQYLRVEFDDKTKSRVGVVQAAVALHQFDMLVLELRARRVTRYDLLDAWAIGTKRSALVADGGWSTELARAVLLRSGAFKPDDLLLAVLHEVHRDALARDKRSSPLLDAVRLVLPISTNDLIVRVVMAQLPEVLHLIDSSSSSSNGDFDMHAQYKLLIEHLIDNDAPLPSLCVAISVLEEGSDAVQQQIDTLQHVSELVVQLQGNAQRRRDYLFGVACALMRVLIRQRRTHEAFEAARGCGVNLWKYAVHHHASVDIVGGQHKDVTDLYTHIVCNVVGSYHWTAESLPVDWLVEMVAWSLGGAETIPAGFPQPASCSLVNYVLNAPFPPQVAVLALEGLARAGKLTHGALRTLVLRAHFSRALFDQMWARGELRALDVRLEGRSIEELVHELTDEGVSDAQSHSLMEQ